MARTFSGRRLRAQREAAGLRLEHVAVALRRSARQIQAYEAGESIPPTPVLIALADHFRCSVDALIDEPAVAA